MQQQRSRQSIQDRHDSFSASQRPLPISDYSGIRCAPHASRRATFPPQLLSRPSSTGDSELSISCSWKSVFSSVRLPDHAFDQDRTVLTISAFSTAGDHKGLSDALQVLHARLFSNFGSEPQFRGEAFSSSVQFTRRSRAITADTTSFS